MSDLITDLAGYGVIVTAAGGSIGSASALALARCGAKLALNDVDAQAVERTCDAVRELGGEAFSIVGDVSEYATVQSLAARAIERMGGVFGLVNIAGAAMPKPILDMSPEEWAITWNVNVTSLFNWAHAVLPHMLASDAGGRIINNSSISGKLAREVAPKITVNAICPGLILNPRTTLLYEARPQMMERYPMARPGVGADIAKAVVYFMAADWVTGEVTDVNGGYFID